MKGRENTEFIVLNYYHNGNPFDLTLELHKTKASIENCKTRIDFADKYNIRVDATEPLPDLISDLRLMGDMLKGRFDILVISERADEKQ